ncbi:MAG TPA: hypothetical protein VHT49_02410 [Acidimicrobiales bacterium]|nr:hypothetical protein [Acidimicrobiales bacterium]
MGDSTGDEEVAIGDDAKTPDGAGAGPSEGEERDAEGAPTRFEKVRRSSAGVIMTGIALGLQDAFELPRKEPAFVIKAAGEPDGEPGPIDLQFDPDDPANTVAVIRPWLADGQKKDPPPT